MRSAALFVVFAFLGCHSHASGPLVVVQCPGPEIDEPNEFVRPFYPPETIDPETRFETVPGRPDCWVIDEEVACFRASDTAIDDGLAEREIDVE